MRKKVLVAILGIFFLVSMVCFGDQENTRPYLILGLSKIELKPGQIVGAQVDRVIRDIAWEDSPWDIKVPPDRIPQKPEDLVPYMEGARISEMMRWAGVQVLPLTPTRAKAIVQDSQAFYYAANGQGEFPFLIDPSKVAYKSVYQAPEEDEVDLILPDTHGFNMVAEQAFLHRKELYLVVACMDIPAKAQAALYLARYGLNIYAPCDRFASLLINYKKRFPDVIGTIIGSAPVKPTEYGAVIGEQPIIIYLDESIAVQYTEKGYPDQYCDTPWRYFTNLNKELGLNLKLIRVAANAGEAYKVVMEARIQDSEVIGVRVWNKADYEAVSAWLKESRNHRAVLLHSAAYEWGIRVFREFPLQVSFGDLMPEIRS